MARYPHGLRSSRRRSVATALTFACMAAGVGACAQSAKPQVHVSLLPYLAAKGQSWVWSSACPYGPHVTHGCAAAGPQLGSSQLAGNEWNLGTAQNVSAAQGNTGSVRMSATPTGALNIKGNLASAPPCTGTTCIARQANTWVRGYPSVLYGVDQCHAQTSPPPSADLPLPAKVGDIGADLIGRTTYDAQASQVTYDVAYDLWLSPTATKTPCQSNGTLEVMVWTDYNEHALLPDSLKVGTTTLPFSVNGAFKSGNQAWSVYVNNVYGGGHTVPWGGTVWLVLDAADATKQGTVSVDLSASLAAVSGLLQHNYGWGALETNYWLDTIAFGMEFGPQGGDPYSTGPANFSLGLSSYCLTVGSSVGSANC